MADELVLDSLQRRMRAMHSLYYDAVATMDLDQVNHFEREGVVPIAFSLFHIVNMIDASFMLMTGVGADLGRVLGAEGAGRPSPTTASTGRVAEMVHQRIGDYAAFRSTWRRCSTGPRSGSTDWIRRNWAGWWSSARFPPQVASTYSARVAGPAGITLLDAAECWIYQHGLRHMGEIELARGLVGLQGMTS